MKALDAERSELDEQLDMKDKTLQVINPWNRPMELFIQLHASQNGSLYIEGSHVIISKNIVFLSLMIDFVLANSADPGKMPHYAAFHIYTYLEVCSLASL